MRAIRAGNLCFAFLTTVALYGSDAEYLGGTVKAIPSNMVGTLDLSDPRDLVFQYGRGVYRLPFERIKTFEFTQAASSRMRAVGFLSHVRVPGLPSHRQAEVLNLSFRNEDNGNGVLSFKITDKDLAAAEWTLKSRIGNLEESASNAARIKLPESWWGDRYWRTTRNTAQRSPADAEPAGTK